MWRGFVVGGIIIFYVDDYCVEGCYGLWLDDFVFVMGGFDDGGNEVCWFDVVWIYVDSVFFVIGIENFCVYGIGIFCIEIENVVDFDIVCR